VIDNFDPIVEPFAGNPRPMAREARRSDMTAFTNTVVDLRLLVADLL